MRPTRWTSLALLFAGAALLAYVLVERAYGSLPPLPILAPVTMALLGGGEAWAGTSLRARLQRRPGTVPPDRIAVARTAALAKASAAVGALMTGAYAGVLLWLFPSVGTVAAARSDALVALVGILAGAALVAGGLWLEWCCRIPGDPDDPDRSTGGRGVEPIGA